MHVLRCRKKAREETNKESDTAYSLNNCNQLPQQPLITAKSIRQKVYSLLLSIVCTIKCAQVCVCVCVSMCVCVCVCVCVSMCVSVCECVCVCV